MQSNASIQEALDRAERARQSGDHATALATLTGLIKQSPDHPAPYLRAAGMFMQLQRFDDAETVLGNGAKRFPGDAGFVIDRAWVALRRGDLDEATARWTHVRKEVPNHPAGFTGGAMALREARRYDEAEQLLLTAIERFPDQPGPLIDHAWLAHVQHNWEIAAERWATVRATFDNAPVGFSAGAGALREAGRLDEAAAILAEAIARFPDDASPVVEWAWLAHHLRDWPAAVTRWEKVRERFPDNISGYVGAGQALRESGRAVEAEALLGPAVDRFPNEAGLHIEFASLAAHRQDWREAARRWDSVQQRFPQHPASYTGAALALRQQRRFREADAIIAEAIERFPADPTPRSEYAWLAHIASDWPEAVCRWHEMRARHPTVPVGYTAGAVALREQSRFDEAEQLLIEAIERFPNERTPLVEHAWLAAARRDWPKAAQRWQRARKRFPGFADCYVREAQALATMWQSDDAERVLDEGIRHFPDDSALACEHAWIAFQRHNFREAASRFAIARERFPQCLTACTGGAQALRNQFRLDEAEALLKETQRRFPEEPGPFFEYAKIPMFAPLRRDRDPDEALRRLAELRDRFPAFEDGYVQALRYLRQEERFAEADSLAQSGLQNLLGNGALSVEYGNNAREQANWPEAIRRYSDAVADFPNNPHAVAGLAAALSMSGRESEAEEKLHEALGRFPANKELFDQYAQIAAQHGRWDEALARWSNAQQRFPDEQSFAHRIFEARLQLADQKGSIAPTADDNTAAVSSSAKAADADPRSVIRELVMQFESLGGRGLGCEFGMFQREFAAEPLGLLRWADMPFEGLLFVLENNFEGVGTSENTELFINRDNSRPEYCTTDRRGFMFMRAFVYEDEMTFDRMWKQALRRIGYLKDKMISDLQAGSKIFVYRLTDRNLTGGEIARLHAAVRKYGDNTLLYVRLEDETHPNGTVECTAPGLMIGYMDRFKMTPDGQLSASPPSDSWLKVCTRTHALWQQVSDQRG